MGEEQEQYYQPQPMPSYKRKIQSLYIDSLDLGEVVRVHYVMKTSNGELMARYVAKLATLYKELRPKVKGRGLADLEMDFNKYNELAEDPQRLYEEPDTKDDSNNSDSEAKLEEHARLIQDFEDVIRRVMDKLKLLPIEDEQ